MRPAGRRAAWAAGGALTEIRAKDLIIALDEASLSRFHLRAVLASGIGFFTGVAVAGFALTLVLPEPAGRSLEDMATSTHDTAAQPLRVAGPRPLIGRTQR
jgi:hypothetical protein